MCNVYYLYFQFQFPFPGIFFLVSQMLFLMITFHDKNKNNLLMWYKAHVFLRTNDTKKFRHIHTSWRNNTVECEHFRLIDFILFRLTWKSFDYANVCVYVCGRKDEKTTSFGAFFYKKYFFFTHCNCNNNTKPYLLYIR